MLGGIAIGTSEFTPMGLLPDIASGVDVSITAAGHLISAYALGVVVGAPLLAVLCAQYPRRALLVWLLIIYLVGNIASAVAPTYPSLLVARFVTGLPHGAYFGVAALVAAQLAGPKMRGWAIARVMLGLSLATVVTVPLLTALGHSAGWRPVFMVVSAIAAAAAFLLWRNVPYIAADPSSSIRGELGALKNPQVLLTLGVGALGFAGMFAVYSYITPTLTERTGVAASTVPIYLLVWGVGMVSGNLLGGRLVDRSVLGTLAGGLAAFALVLTVFAGASLNRYTALLGVFALGHVQILAPALQARLMDVAGDAQTLAATMMHASVNTANALGPWLAGIAFTATATWAAPSLTGATLATAGLALLGISLLASSRNTAASASAPKPTDSAEFPT
ncbi:MAG: MFS transporter [Solirubrobacterales bacterium]